MFVFAGILAACTGLGAYLFPSVRNAEDLLPDFDEATPPAEEAARKRENE